jgi:hypothetical protein
MADLDELLARMAKDAALLNAYHEWEMPAPAPAEAINYASVADRIERAVAAIASLREERDAAIARADACQQQAEQWKGEALAHKSSLHEAYQVLTGASGEPANWNGARPFRQFKQMDQEAFIVWIRRWSKSRFGKWITHNTAKGAFNGFSEERAQLMRETLAATSITTQKPGNGE